MPSAPSMFSYHSVARCASPALPPAPRAMAGMPRAIGTFASVDALASSASRRRARRDVELRQGAGILAAEVQVEPRLLRNRVEAGAAAQPHHGAGGARGLLGWEVGEQSSGAPHGVGRVSDAERRPRVAPRAPERHVISLGAEGAMDHAVEPGAVQGDESDRGGMALSPFPFPRPSTVQ